MALVVPGLFATIALPAYAVGPEITVEEKEQAAAVELADLRISEAQQVSVSADATLSAVSRDAFTATTVEELAAKRAAELRAKIAAEYKAAYSGKTASQYLANPAYPNYSMDGIVSVARQYLGVPYVYGGASPAGFDCSGLTMFVFAQFGISLPHSASAQGSMGTRIAPSAALPGDLIIINGGAHVGIYIGGGLMIDAPMPGRVVSIRAPWTSDYYFVRIGI
jgi:cell wall-associated NlpC family hydrolase